MRTNIFTALITVMVIDAIIVLSIGLIVAEAVAS